MNNAVVSLEIKKLRKALEFYANSDNYWNTPLSLHKNFCMSTLHAVKESRKGNKVLVDRGNTAREALKRGD